MPGSAICSSPIESGRRQSAWVLAGRFQLLDELFYEHQPLHAVGGPGEIMLDIDLGFQLAQLPLASRGGFAAKLLQPLRVALVPDLLQRLPPLELQNQKIRRYRAPRF